MLKKVLCAVVCVAFFASHGWAGWYQISELAPLPGDVATNAVAMSASGTYVVGDSEANGFRRPFIYTASGGVREIVMPAGLQCRAVNVNDNGQVIIRAYDSAADLDRSYTWSNGQYFPLGSNLVNVYGRSANDTYVVGNSNMKAFVQDSSGTNIILPNELTNSYYSNVFDVNASGIAVGLFETTMQDVANVFRLDLKTGQFNNLGSFGTVRLPDGSYGVPRPVAIGDNGFIACQTYKGDRQDHFLSVVWDGVSVNNAAEPLLKEIPVLGSSTMNVMDINSTGMAVGCADWNVGSDWGHAFLWNYGQSQTLDLNDFIDPASGWRLFSATSIANNGTIVGWGSLNGVDRGFVLTPVPEPAALIMISVAAIMIVVIFVRPVHVLQTYTALVKWREKK